MSTSSTDVVRAVLESRLTNRTLLKDAFILAKRKNLDSIIGLLLKALGLDKDKCILNIGGMDLHVIKPSWIYPSLGIRATGRSRGHRRENSLDYVLSGLMRRSSTGASPDKDSLDKREAVDGGGVADKEGVSPVVVPTPGRSSEAEDVYKLSKSWDANKFEVYYTSSSPPSSTPSRYVKERQRRLMASKPPSLPTVVCSPVPVVKETPPKLATNDILVSSDYEKFQGSFAGEGVVKGGVAKEGVVGEDEVDGGRGSERDSRRGSVASRDDESSRRVPQRRHTFISNTVTGASYLPFNTLDLFQQQGATNLPHSSPASNKMAAEGDTFSPGFVRRTVLKNQLAKRQSTPPGLLINSSQSRSSSPFQSSDEVGVVALGGASKTHYNILLDSITTTPKDKRSELLSSLISSTDEGVDQSDGAAGPSPSGSSSSFYIKSIDLSANQLESLNTLVNDPIPSKLKELLYVDMKQNKLTGLPEPLFQVSNYKLFIYLFVYLFI